MRYLNRRIPRSVLTLLLSAMLVLTALPAAAFAAGGGLPDVNDKAVCYTPANDYRGGDCIMTSTKVMVRRACIARGSSMWTTLTNASIRRHAAPFGLLLHNFTLNVDGMSYQIGCAKFKSLRGIKGEAARNKARTEEIRKILATHPEGIVVWGRGAARSGTHGVLAVAVKGGVIYAADSSCNRGSVSKGVQKWSDTTMRGVSRCTQYWYIKKVSGSSASASGGKAESTATITGVRAPGTIKAGNGFGIRGSIVSNYKIKKVTVQIIGADGKTALSTSATPDSWMYDVAGLDNDVKFGSLEGGEYKYRISVTDEKKTTVVHENDFTVKGGKGAKTSEAKVSSSGGSSSSVSSQVAAGSPSKLRVTDLTAPNTCRQGKSFAIRGKVKSNKKIRRVEIRIEDANGKTFQTAVANTNRRTYNLRKLDKKIVFGKLAKGSYVLKIIAKDTKQTKVLIEKPFEVIQG